MIHYIANHYILSHKSLKSKSDVHTERPRVPSRVPAVRVPTPRRTNERTNPNRTTARMDRLESDIMAYLPTILRGADLEKSTVKSLQKELETKLGMGLSEKKNFIREQVRARIRIRILRPSLVVWL